MVFWLKLSVLLALNKAPTFVGFIVCEMMGRFASEGDSFGQETYITTAYISLYGGHSDYEKLYSL